MNPEPVASARSRGRRALLAASIAAALHACGPGGGEQGSTGASPGPGAARNVILLSIDTLRADHLGCYGYARETSPALDALAQRGALFEDVVSSSSWTVPAHMSMLTGLYPRSHGVSTDAKELPAETTTLAEHLSGLGFVAGAIVNTGLLRKHGFPRGFVLYDVLNPRERAGADSAAGARASAPTIVARARAWLQARPERRFFLLLHLYDLHTDYAPRPEYLARFERPYSGTVTGTTTELRDYMMRAPGTRELGPEDARRLIDLYDAEIRQLDDAVAGLFATLDELGLAEDTLLVVTSDHGEEFLDHGDVLHGKTLHPEMVQVPLILVGPGVPRGARIRGQVSPVDLFPTIATLLGVSRPDGLEGLDLSAAWRAPAAWPPQRALFAETRSWPGHAEGSLHAAIRKDSWALHYDHLSGEKRLFHHDQDPGELTDLAARDPERVEALWRELEAFLANAKELEDQPISEEELEELRALGYR